MELDTKRCRIPREMFEECLRIFSFKGHDLGVNGAVEGSLSLVYHTLTFNLIIYISLVAIE
jgi:hypothetical protein